MNLHDHRIRTLEAQIQIHEAVIRQHTESPQELEAIRLLRVRIVDQLNLKLNAHASTPSASNLAAELRAAKAAHTACKCFVQMPHTTQVSTARTYLSKSGSPYARNDKGAKPHYKTLDDLDAVLQYRKEKAALADTIAKIQQRIFEASQESNLE